MKKKDIKTDNSNISENTENNSNDIKEKTYENESHQNNKKYIKRLLISLIIFLISYIGCILLINKTFIYKDSKIIKYQDKQNIDYKVYLKKNDFYESDYLDKDMMYVSNLIDKIDIDFTYDFLIVEEADIDFNYRIVGDLIISSPTGNKNYFNKQYVLLDNKKASINNQNTYKIQENIKIDYDYYNNLASSFKNQFVVDTNSYLKVYLEIEKKTKDGAKYELNDTSISSINIPLSQRSVEIKFDVPDTTEVKDAVISGKLDIDVKMLILLIISLIVAIISFVFAFKLILIKLPRKSKYEKKLKKILKEYDRLIVETTTLFDENSNIIKINDFDELLDVRDNLKLPIMYYNVTTGKKCYFYIKNDNDIYLYELNIYKLEK